MKGFCLGIVGIILIASCSVAPGNNGDTRPPVKLYDMTNRTVNNLIVVFLAAGNNLQMNAVVDIAEMESAISNLRAKGDDLILYFDAIADRNQYAGYATSYYGAVAVSNAWYLYPGGAFDPQGVDSSGYLTAKRVYTNANLNTGDPACLSNFLHFVKEHFTYNTLTLVLWNHGNSIFPMGTASYARDENPYKSLAPLYFGYDQTADESMSDEEVRYAISNTVGNVDALAFDACIMGNIEVAYEYRSICDYYIASPNYVPTDGYPYDTWLNAWAQSPSNDTRTLVNILVDTFADYYRAHDYANVYECLYSMKMPEGADVLAQKLNSLASLIVANTNVNRAWMMSACDKAPLYASSAFWIDYDLTYTWPSEFYTLGALYAYIATNSGNPTAMSLYGDVSNALAQYVHRSTNYGEPALFIPLTYQGALWFKGQNWYAPANLALLTDYPLIWTVTTGEDYKADEKTEGMMIDWTNASLLAWNYAVVVKSMSYLTNPPGAGSIDNALPMSPALMKRTNAVHMTDDADHYYKFNVQTGGTFGIKAGFDTGLQMSDYMAGTSYVLSVYNSNRVFVAGITAGDIDNNVNGTFSGFIDSDFIIKNDSWTNTEHYYYSYTTFNLKTSLSPGQYYLRVNLPFTFGPEWEKGPYLLWLGTNNTVTFQ